MNWSRGLFRLWVAVSVLWIATTLSGDPVDQAAIDYFETRSERQAVTESPTAPWLNFHEGYMNARPEQRVALASDSYTTDEPGGPVLRLTGPASSADHWSPRQVKGKNLAAP